MPSYQLRFIVESCLTKTEDLSVTFGGHTATFLFSKKTSADKAVVVLINREATNHRTAHDQVASMLLPSILDALSFATGTPMLLGECELTLKDEAGSATRRAIYIGHRKSPSQAQLTSEAVQEMQRILENGNELRLPLCWHRYALQRQLALEQFVFHWLAFEALAGEADVASHCPTCQEVVQHCGGPVTHRSSNKVAAREIFRSANPDVTIQNFNKRIWSKARNSVFHGKSYPEPAYLFELHALATQLHKATDKKITTTLGLEEGERIHRYYETWYRHFLSSSGTPLIPQLVSLLTGQPITCAKWLQSTPQEPRIMRPQRKESIFWTTKRTPLAGSPEQLSWITAPLNFSKKALYLFLACQPSLTGREKSQNTQGFYTQMDLATWPMPFLAVAPGVVLISEVERAYTHRSALAHGQNLGSFPNQTSSFARSC